MCGVTLIEASNCRKIIERQFSSFFAFNNNGNNKVREEQSNRDDVGIVPYIYADGYNNVVENNQPDYVRFNAMEKLMQARSSGGKSYSLKYLATRIKKSDTN